MWEWRPFAKLTGIDFTIGKIDEHQLPLFDEEFALVSSSVESRVREFTAGRALARSALRRMAIEQGAIRTGEGGQPVWPDGVTGSISHNATYVAVAVAGTASYKSIGIDVESRARMDAETLAMALTDSERAGLGRDAPDDLALSIFSGKEAAFKAVYPLARQPFEFRDIEVTLRGGEFRVAKKDDSSAAAYLAAGRGHVELRPDLIASIFCIR